MSSLLLVSLYHFSLIIYFILTYLQIVLPLIVDGKRISWQLSFLSSWSCLWILTQIHWCDNCIHFFISIWGIIIPTCTLYATLLIIGTSLCILFKFILHIWECVGYIYIYSLFRGYPTGYISILQLAQVSGLTLNFKVFP